MPAICCHPPARKPSALHLLPTPGRRERLGRARCRRRLSAARRPTAAVRSSLSALAAHHRLRGAQRARSERSLGAGTSAAQSGCASNMSKLLQFLALPSVQLTMCVTRCGVVRLKSTNRTAGCQRPGGGTRPQPVHPAAGLGLPHHARPIYGSRRDSRRSGAARKSFQTQSRRL